jgi:iron complex transport system ATP-binding protein
MVLDEPSTALDFAASIGLTSAMRGLISGGHTLALVTHHPGEIPPEIGRVILLEQGQIVADGPKKKVLTSSALSELFHVPLNVSWPDGWCDVRPA